MESASRATRWVGWLSWFSLAVPFVAYLLCVAASRWPYGMPVSNVLLIRRYGFLISGMVGALVLVALALMKRPRLAWMPIAGLALSGLLYAWTERMIWIL
jgi:hypothetical protein